MKTTSWGNVAEWYHVHLTDPDSYHAQVVLPNLRRILGITKGESVLDLACGNGFFSEIFHSQGARVIGVDISPELIARAENHASKDIHFIVSKAHELKDIYSKSIDKIVCILAIQNIKEVKELFIECERVLKDSGKLVIVMNHPAFRMPKGSQWGRDEKTQKQYRRIDYYLSEKTVEIDMHPGQKIPNVTTLSFHRPLQFYIKNARNAGFALTSLEEWISHKQSQKGPHQKEEDRMRKEIPLFLMCEFFKK